MHFRVASGHSLRLREDRTAGLGRRGSMSRVWSVEPSSASAQVRFEPTSTTGMFKKQASQKASREGNDAHFQHETDTAYSHWDHLDGPFSI